MKNIILSSTETIESNDESTSATKENTSNGDSESAVKVPSCCIKSKEEFLAILPDTLGKFIAKRSGSVNLRCLDDAESISSINKSYYADGVEERFKVTLKDYCPKPFDEFKHLADPSSKMIADAEGEMKKYETDNLWGYAKYYKQNKSLNSGNPAHLKVIINKKFYLDIQNLEASSIDDVISLFEQISLVGLE